MRLCPAGYKQFMEKSKQCNRRRQKEDLSRLADFQLSTEVFCAQSQSVPLAFLFEDELVVLAAGMELLLQPPSRDAK